MKVLVVAASKYGSTREIAQTIGGVLRDLGLDATVLAPEEVDRVKDYDAVVLGSAVYAGHWLKAAKELAHRSAGAFADRPVWLFSSGPIGDPPKPEGDPVDVKELLEATGARDHRVFAGRIARKELGFADKAIVIAMRVPDGDFRDWGAIKDWAAGIAKSLQPAS